MSEQPPSTTEPSISLGFATPEEIMQAHQLLYYVMSKPIWSDYDYDLWCSRKGLFGGGGSDFASSYSLRVRAIATLMSLRPNDFRP